MGSLDENICVYYYVIGIRFSYSNFNHIVYYINVFYSNVGEKIHFYEEP
jgi:hypothetical protein